LGTFLRAKSDLCLVGEARNGTEALHLCDRLQPDVILMDLVMPKMDGATATRLIRERHPEMCIVALTSFKEKERVQEVLRAGAMGYLLKTVSADDLAETIRTAYAGRSTLDPEAVEALVRVDPPAPGHNLTPREREVLSLLSEGLSNPDIAARLYVSRATIKAHVAHILAKLGVSNRAEAVALAIQQQLV
jgi:NarL family two-component system response regulator LiaR